MAGISPEQLRALRIHALRALRIHAQHLRAKASRGDMVEVVRSLCGVNAQSRPAMMLSLRSRIKGLDMTDIIKTVEKKRALVRTWAMRGTIHLLDSEDLSWIVSLLGPAIIAKGRGRRLELGLNDEILAKSLGEIPTILKDGKPLTRGVDIDRTGQAPYHLIAYAALKGLLCMGPDRPNGDPTYGLVDGWTGKQKSFTREQALAELTYRYLRGYGPAGPKDLAAWSGLSLADAKKGWELVRKKETLKELKVEERTLWSLETQFKSLNELAHVDTTVNLLPAFDAFILGYSDREYLVPDQYQKEVYHGGQTVPVVLVNGLAAGVWRYERQGKKLNVKISPFGSLDRTVKGLIEEEVEDIGRFFGLSSSLFLYVNNPRR